MALVAGVAGLATGVILWGRPSTGALLIGAIALMAVAPVVVRVAQRRWDPFEPLFVFSLVWVGMFVVRPLAMLHYNEFSYIWAGGLPMRQAFDRMLLLALLSGIAFLVGYALPAGGRLARWLPGPPEGYRTATVVSLSVGAGLFGVLLFGLALLTSGVPDVSVVLAGQSAAQLDFLSRADKFLVLGPLLLVGATLVTFALGLGQRRPALTALGIGLAVVTFLVWNVFGSRTVLFPLFGALVLFTFLVRERRPGPLAVAVAVLFAIFASAWTGQQRYAETRVESGLVTVATRIATHPGQMFEPLLRGPDNAMAPGLAAAMVVVPSQQSYSYGLPLLRDLVSRAVPRKLWAGKPRPPREALIARMNPTGYQQRTANPEFSALLLPYLSWGLFGAAFLVLYGIAARTIFAWAHRHRTKLVAQLLYALMIPLLLTLFRDGLVDALFLWGLMLGPVLLVFRFGRIRAT